MRLGFIGALCAIGILGGSVQAATVTYSDKAAFLAATGATGAGLPSLNPGAVGTSYTLGDLTFNAANTMFIQEWSARLAGSELAISGFEDLNVSISSPIELLAFGFDFVEPQFDPNVNAPFVDSTFSVTLLSGNVTVGSIEFNAPNDQAYFVGIRSTVPFNRVEIREIAGNNENEFYGDFYTAAVPLPSAAWAGMALMGVIGSVRALRRRQA